MFKNYDKFQNSDSRDLGCRGCKKPGLPTPHTPYPWNCQQVTSLQGKRPSSQWWQSGTQEDRMIAHSCHGWHIFFFSDHTTWLSGLSSPPGIELMPLALEAWSPNHWTTREVPRVKLFTTCEPHLIHMLSFFYSFKKIKIEFTYYKMFSLMAFRRITGSATITLTLRHLCCAHQHHVAQS